jgi:hypothetical protein
VAVLTHVEGETLVSLVPGQTIDTEYRHASNVCDHCHTIRPRTETFIIQHEDGTQKQIGRNCLSDFLGVIDTQQLLESFEMLRQVESELSEMGEEREGGLGGAHALLNLHRYLSIVATIMRTTGWTSRKTEQETARTSTATLALEQIYMRGSEKIEITDTDRASASSAIAWAASIENPENDYLHNLATLARMGAIPARMTGIAASMIVAFDKTLERERERQEMRISTYQGHVGDKAIFALEINGLRNIEGQYGLTVLHLFIDSTGNRFKWFASGGVTLGQVGENVTVKATIKGHDEYQSVKYTVLTRCKQMA